MPKWLWLIILLIMCETIALVRAHASPRNEDTLRSFYAVRFYFSDLLSAWSNTILDVAPNGDDVRVRVIRISQANAYCPNVLVRAAEKIVPHTSVRRIAGKNICAFTSNGVEAALKAAASRGGDPSDSATETIVADCNGTQREFDFPYPVDVDLKVLDRSAPAVSTLWDTRYNVVRRIFGKHFTFNDLPPSHENAMEQLGTQVVPELASGKYQTAYAGSKCGDRDCDNYLAWRLRGYTGPPQPIERPVGILVGADSLHFVKYVAPVFPAIALTAHVSGDVHLRIEADHQTGTVTNVQIISGPPVLIPSAENAARSWQFAPETSSEEPLEVTLRFELNCPGN